MKHVNKQSGQTLVALLAFMAMAITITSAATVITVESLKATTLFSLGNQALSTAEAGADNAILRLIRDPTYTGETLAVGTGTAIISVSGAGPAKTILSEGVAGNSRRQVQVIVSQANNIVTVTSWSEIP